jgi:hypothetical protein
MDTPKFKRRPRVKTDDACTGEIFEVVGCTSRHGGGQERANRDDIGRFDAHAAGQTEKGRFQLIFRWRWKSDIWLTLAKIQVVLRLLFWNGRKLYGACPTPMLLAWGTLHVFASSFLKQRRRDVTKYLIFKQTSHNTSRVLQGEPAIVCSAVQSKQRTLMVPCPQ